MLVPSLSLYTSGIFRRLIFIWPLLFVACATFSGVGGSREIALALEVPEKSQNLSSRELEAIDLTLRGFIVSVREGNLEALGERLHPSESIYVDLKSPLSKGEILKRLNDPSDFYYALYWDTPRLKELTGEGSAKSFQGLFRSARKYRARVYVVAENRVEVRLDFRKRPGVGMMGNLILERLETPGLDDKGRWYIRQLP